MFKSSRTLPTDLAQPSGLSPALLSREGLISARILHL